VTRKLSNFAAIVSLMLCIATVVVWVESYRRGEIFGHWTVDPLKMEGIAYDVELVRGSFVFQSDRIRPYGLEIWQASVVGHSADVPPKRIWGTQKRSGYFHRVDRGKPVPPYVFELLTALSPPNSVIARLGFWSNSAKTNHGHTEFIQAASKRIDVYESPFLARERHETHVPMWTVTALFLLFGMPLVWRTKRYFFPLADACRECGYSLTSNTSGVCPECGTPVPPPTKSSVPTDKSPRPHEPVSVPALPTCGSRVGVE
jgi:hypothetical protein